MDRLSLTKLQQNKRSRCGNGHFRCSHGNHLRCCLICQLPSNLLQYIASFVEVTTVYSAEELKQEVERCVLPYLRLEIFCSSGEEDWDIVETLRNSWVREVQVEFYKEPNHGLLDALLGLKRLYFFGVICKELSIQDAASVCATLQAAGRQLDILHLAHTRPSREQASQLCITDKDAVDAESFRFLEEAKLHGVVRTLLLNGNEFGERTGRVFGEALRQEVSALETLYVGLNKLQNEGTVPIARALATNRTLRTLNLRDNEIGDAGAVALGRALRSNFHLQELFLSLNDIQDVGAAALGDSLKLNTNLRVLDLVRNKVGPKGCRRIAKALKENSSLRVLRLKGNFLVGNRGACAFAEALVKNKGLRQLHLEGCRIADRGGMALGKALRHNDALHVLDLKDNEIEPSGAESLSVGLRMNTCLQCVDLSCNLVAPKVLKALHESVETNRKKCFKMGPYQHPSFRDPAIASFLRYMHL